MKVDHFCQLITNTGMKLWIVSLTNSVIENTRDVKSLFVHKKPISYRLFLNVIGRLQLSLHCNDLASVKLHTSKSCVITSKWVFWQSKIRCDNLLQRIWRKNSSNISSEKTMKTVTWMSGLKTINMSTLILTDSVKQMTSVEWNGFLLLTELVNS